LEKYFYLVLMTLNEAFLEFSNSDDFKEIARKKDREGGRYRVYLLRFKREELKNGAIVEHLLANGYEIKANKVRKKR
jgi:hypothetical protein